MSNYLGEVHFLFTQKFDKTEDSQGNAQLASLRLGDRLEIVSPGEKQSVTYRFGKTEEKTKYITEVLYLVKKQFLVEADSERNAREKLISSNDKSPGKADKWGDQMTELLNKEISSGGYELSKWIELIEEDCRQGVPHPMTVPPITLPGLTRDETF